MTAVSTIGAAVLWGFGVWWLAAALVLLGAYLRRGRLPYGLGWWAFTFPLGAFTASTLGLGRAWHIDVLEGLAACCSSSSWPSGWRYPQAPWAPSVPGSHLASLARVWMRTGSRGGGARSIRPRFC